MSTSPRPLSFPTASPRLASVAVLGLAALLAWGVMSCDDAARGEIVANDTIWTDPGSEDPVEAPITYMQRGPEARYGLPCSADAGSVAELQALMDQVATSSQAPDIYLAPGVEIQTDQCRGGEPEVFVELPMTLEVTVTLHPRQYMKIAVCGQDERNYGTFTVEDDTGGIIVLRDSRVAPWTYGSRVRMHVRGVMRTFSSDIGTRAVLIADITPIEQDACPGVDEGTVLYTPQEGPFGDPDIGFTRQVEGFVHVEPTNDNFNAMVVSSERYTVGIAEGKTLEGDMLQCVRSCEQTCRLSGDAVACADICYERCDDAIGDAAQLGIELDIAEVTRGVVDGLPTLWNVGLDAELGRRGITAPPGTRIRVRGPVVSHFGRQIWVLSTGQFEFLEPLDN